MLFHDLGKGRGADHSGSVRIVERTGPRLGLVAEGRNRRLARASSPSAQQDRVQRDADDPDRERRGRTSSRPTSRLR
jgi:hypothetical protein